MSEDLRKSIEALEQTLHVLDRENSHLAERADDSLLLGLFSESIESASSTSEVLESALERIAVLKSLPFAGCIKLKEDGVERIASYSTFSNVPDLGDPLVIEKNVLDALENGPLIIQYGNGIKSSFDPVLFSPRYVVLIPFSVETIDSGVFIFMAESDDFDRLSRMLDLLRRSVEMTASRLENIFLLSALSHADRHLEPLVERRTRDLLRANTRLQQELEKRKASQDALLNSIQTVITVLDNLDAFIFAADLESEQILFMNRRLIDKLGHDHTGKRLSDVILFHEEGAGCIDGKQLFNDVGQPAEPIIRQTHDRINDSWYVISEQAVKWTDGRFVRLHFTTDITPIKDKEASAYGIKQNHNGMITVDSEPGRGSAFKVYLPASAQALPPAVRTETASQSGNETILLVDDERMIREVAKQMLERLGYRVIIAEHGEKALEILKVGGIRFHLIILDLMMPGMDGGETFEKMQEIDPKIPVLLSSGYSITGYASSVLDKGCKGFLQKPFNLAELSASIRTILDE
jgi:CheY-like chemotaxis protein